MARTSFNQNQKSLLILLLLVLAAIRFLGVPFYDYQTEQITQLNLTSKQLERANRLLDMDISQEHITEVSDRLREYESDFIQYTNANTFRLQAQTAIQSATETNAAQLELFDWLSSEERYQGYLQVHQARIVLQGATQDIVQAQLAIQECVRGVKVLEFALQERRTRARQGGESRLTLLVEIAGVVG